MAQRAEVDQDLIMFLDNKPQYIFSQECSAIWVLKVQETSIGDDRLKTYLAK
jgi:hypothetical protein